jgi:peptide/nickel transport system substrate-binding protein
VSVVPRGFGAAIACFVVAVGMACVPPPPPRDPGVLIVSKEQTSAWTRNFNPLSPLAAPRWPTIAGIYEPLAVWNSVQGHYVPWLATAWTFADDGRSARVTLRDGVRWSDGRPLVADDVVSTFALLRRVPSLDKRGVWSFLADVQAVPRAEAEPAQVEFVFSRVFFPGFDDVLAQPIVPTHIWQGVADPIAFANESPVGTGPFTEVTRFERQVYELGRNPYGWHAPADGTAHTLTALRFPALPGNDRANLALAFDEVDLAANFVPAIDRVYVDRDPEHHHYWFPLTGNTIFLYPNTTRAPLSNVKVRRAIAHAIDRALVVDIGVFGYSRAADATALSDGFVRWRNEEVANNQGALRFDVALANRLLDEAGLARGADGRRRGPDGKPLSWSLLTVAGWTDWIRAAQVIARSLGDVGIDTRVTTYDFGAWFEHLQTGDFDLSIGWSIEGPTPWVFYRWLMSPDTVKPLGTPAVGNWHRYGSVAAGALLQRFEREKDEDAQRAILRDVQALFFEELPAVPLFYTPSWAAYSTRYFTGFPSATDPYCDPSPNKDDRGETLLWLTRLQARSPTSTSTSTSISTTPSSPTPPSLPTPPSTSSPAAGGP